MVVEFPRDLPTSGFITLAFHPEGSNAQLASSVPVAKLGPNTVKANFPSKFASYIAILAIVSNLYCVECIQRLKSCSGSCWLSMHL